MLVVMAGAGIKGIGVRDVGSRVTRVSGQGSWVQGWVGGPPKGLQSAAVTLVTSSRRVKSEAYKRLTKELQS